VMHVTQHEYVGHFRIQFGNRRIQTIMKSSVGIRFACGSEFLERFDASDENVALTLANRIQRQIDGGPIQQRFRSLLRIGRKLEPKQPQDNGLKNVLSVFAAAGHAICGAIDQLVVLAESLLQLFGGWSHTRVRYDRHVLLGIDTHWLPYALHERKKVFSPSL